MIALRDDSGATIIVVALCLVVLIAFVGLVIDVGRVFAERRELSRGADAAVLAVAADCGTHTGTCDHATALDTADSYADANADDGAAGIAGLALDLDERTVWARTETADPDDGSNRLDLLFMRVLGFESTTVTAEATATWGYPAGGSVLPLIVSDCEWFRFVDPETGPDESTSVVLFFHDGRTTEPCNAQAGQDTDGDGVLAGGFGWVSTSGSCSADVGTDDWVSEDPGASPSTGCGADELRDLIFDRTVLIAYFDDTDGLGANGRYHVAGVGAFHVTGYNFGGQFRAPSTALAPCRGDERCISGYFSTAVIDEGDLGGEDRGVVIVRLIG